MSQRTERLEREAEQTRQRLSLDLQELRARATPGHVLDQVLDYARDSGGADFMRNFGGQVRDNPLPVAIIGASMAWLMFGNQRARSGDSFAAAGTTLRERAGRAGDSAGDAMQRAGETAQGLSESAMERAGEAAQGISESAVDAARRTRDRVSASGQALYGSTRGGMDRAMAKASEARRGLSKTIEEQPLILVGLGLAIGAAIGTALPVTEIERQMLGDVGHQIKEGGAEAVRAAKDEIVATATQAAGDLSAQPTAPLPGDGGQTP